MDYPPKEMTAHRYSQDTHLKFNPMALGGIRWKHRNLPPSATSHVQGTVTAVGVHAFKLLAPKLAILPSDSYHVTILGGANGWTTANLNGPKTSLSSINYRMQSHHRAEVRAIQNTGGDANTFRLDKKTIAPPLASGLQLCPPTRMR
jgi:hypothetical protein